MMAQRAMVHAESRVIVCFLVLLMLPALVSATHQGRLIGTVVDPDGRPIEGVRVTATSEQVPGFREIEVSDQKGKFKIYFEVVDVVYSYLFEKSGYQTMKVDQPWRKPGTARTQFVMNPGSDQVADDSATGTDVFVAPAAEAYNAGAAAFEAGSFDAALASFEKALEHEPELHQAWGAKGATLLELGRYQESVEAAEKALALGSTSVAVLRTRWKAYRELGDEDKTAEAQADLERMSSLAEEAKVVYNEGVVLAQRDQHEAAFATFKQACELDPYLVEAQLALAASSLQLGRNEEALAAAMAILEAHPGDEQATKIRYNAAMALQDEREMAAALVGLAQVDRSTAANGLWVLGNQAYEADNFGLAKTRFSALLRIDPNNAAAHYSLGLIFLNEQAEDEARRHLTRFIELAPGNPDAATARELLDFLGSK